MKTTYTLEPKEVREALKQYLADNIKCETNQLVVINIKKVEHDLDDSATVIIEKSDKAIGA